MKYQLELTITELMLLQTLLADDMSKFSHWVDDEGFPLMDDFFENLDAKLANARGV